MTLEEQVVAYCHEFGLSAVVCAKLMDEYWRDWRDGVMRRFSR
jgi:hypothetical protein